jgi:hypothetical protein
MRLALELNFYFSICRVGFLMLLSCSISSVLSSLSVNTKLSSLLKIFALKVLIGLSPVFANVIEGNLKIIRVRSIKQLRTTHLVLHIVKLFTSVINALSYKTWRYQFQE